jgi:hypothetical protein
MPEITLLQPTVLLGVIQELQFPDTFRGTSLLRSGGTEPNPWPVAEWDVVASNKEIASPNVPNTEAKIVPRLGVGKRTASLMYLREKKIFKATTLHWLRTPGQLAQKSAEEAVMREIKDLDRRFAAFVEFSFWQMVTGTLTLNYPDVKATVSYGMAGSHLATVSTAWSSAGSDIIGDVQAWKLLVNQDGAGAVLDKAVVNSTTMGYLPLNTAISTLFTDRMKDAYLSTGGIQGLLGIAWESYDATYVNSLGATVKYVPDDRVFAYSMGPERPWYLMEGPSADHEAPSGHIGKFAKSWIEPDPSARQYLEEYHFLPILERPDQLIYADVS